MTWDQLRADLARVLEASFPEEADSILCGVERRREYRGDDPSATGIGETKKVFLSDLAAAVADSYPDRGDRILHKLQRILEPPQARGDVTKVVGVNTDVGFAPGSAPILAVIACEDRAALGRLLVLDRSPIVVGRASACDFRLTPQDVSRRHLEITVENGVVRVCDQRSMNGTFVNGIRVAPLTEVVVHPGDRVRLSNVILSMMPLAPPVHRLI